MSRFVLPYFLRAIDNKSVCLPVPLVSMSSFYDFTMDSITGDPVSFEKYRDQVCLVVNVASR
jgi:hypothetical protein